MRNLAEKSGLGIVVALALTACSSSEAPRPAAISSGPDEFSVVPNLPLDAPEDFRHFPHRHRKGLIVLMRRRKPTLLWHWAVVQRLKRAWMAVSSIMCPVMALIPTSAQIWRSATSGFSARAGSFRSRGRRTNTNALIVVLHLIPLRSGSVCVRLA